MQEYLLLAHELVRGYARKNRRKSCAIKIDLKGAYDNMNWNSLMLLFKRIGVPNKIRGWIHMYISTVKYSIIVNGEVCGYFEGKKGQRQGDPLSPV